MTPAEVGYVAVVLFCKKVLATKKFSSNHLQIKTQSPSHGPPRVMSPTAVLARRGARALAAGLTQRASARVVAPFRRGLASQAADANATNQSSGLPRFAALIGTAAASAGAYAFLLDDTQSSAAQFKLFEYLAPTMRVMDPETAHNVGIELLAKGVAPMETRPDHPSLAVDAWGLRFTNPLGLAAGFDKDAKAFPALESMGFGFVEIGSVTPKPQPGNPKPRVFRLREHGAVINRYGFNSEGHGPARTRLEAYRANVRATQAEFDTTPVVDGERVPSRLAMRGAPVGVNLGKNKLTPEAAAADDYVLGVQSMGHTADYIVVNISSPNTPGLRNLQSKAHLKGLLGKVLKSRDDLAVKLKKESGHSHKPPVLLKIAPDLTDSDIKDVVHAATSCGVDGIIVSNTTIARPDEIKAHISGGEAGGLSGKPLLDKSTAVLSRVYELTRGKIPLVGCGGVASGRDAYAKIRAGASLVQMYTAFAYAGPALVPEMKEELARCLREDGYGSVRDAIGADHRKGGR